MLVQNALTAAVRRLQEAAVDAPRLDAWLLLGAVTEADRAALMAGHPQSLSSAQASRFEALLSRRCTREPMAYILGEKEFWSLPFLVGQDVLIPRPDSETLIHAAMEALPCRKQCYRILDLGSGSGCLLLALLSERPAATGIGIDQSANAVCLARRNAERLGLAERATFYQGDWATGVEEQFDLILCNPPYVAAADHARLEPEVRYFEPPLALIAGADGLSAYRQIAPDLPGLLADDGAVCLELGQGQAPLVTAIMAAAGLDMCALHADLSGVDRCLVLKRSPSVGPSGFSSA